MFIRIFHTSIFLANSSTSFISSPNIEAPNQYIESFASEIISSLFLAFIMLITGPKTSSSNTFIHFFTS